MRYQAERKMHTAAMAEKLLNFAFFFLNIVIRSYVDPVG